MIPVKSAAVVVGAGTMGGGIAMAYANAGIPVLLKDVDQAALDRGLGDHSAELCEFGAKGPDPAGSAEDAVDRITPTAEL